MTNVNLKRMAWRNLWRHRRRTILTLSAIVFGTFLSIIMQSMQDMNWADMIRVAARLGAGHVTMQHPEYLDAPTMSRSITNVTQLRAVASSHPDTSHVVERIPGFALLSTARENVGAGFLAVAPEHESEDTLQILAAITEGAFFESSTDTGIILGATLANNLDAELGSKIVYTLTDRDGEVVSGLARISGIIQTGAKTVDSTICLLPIDTVRDLIGFGPEDTIQVASFIDDQRQSDAVASNIQADVPATGVAVLTWAELQPDLASFILMKLAGSWFIMAIVGALVAAGIFNTMFVGVMERLREFGIMLAVGFTPKQLFRLIMWESSWMATVGLAGAAIVTIGPYWYLSNVGIDLTALMAGMEAAELEIAGIGLPNPMMVGIYRSNLVMICTLAVSAVLLSGLYPAWRACRTEPVETIRVG